MGLGGRREWETAVHPNLQRPGLGQRRHNVARVVTKLHALTVAGFATEGLEAVPPRPVEIHDRGYAATIPNKGEGGPRRPAGRTRGAVVRDALSIDDA